MKKKKPDISELLASSLPSNWSPPAEFTDALDDVIRHNRLNRGPQRVGAERVHQWLRKHGVEVSGRRLSAYLRERATTVK